MPMRSYLFLLLSVACAPPGQGPGSDDSGRADSSGDSDDGDDTADTADDTAADTGPSDRDGDGWRDEEDCEPDLADAYPGAFETCNKRDDDCDGEVDDITTGGEVSGYLDADGDGWGDQSGERRYYCWASQVSVSTRFGDCDDADPTVSPGAEERCDGVDQDCDGAADPTTSRYADADGDGHGDGADVSTDCAEIDRVDDADDCDDTSATTYAGATERCDGVDNDCDGEIDEGSWYVDGDGDGYGAGEGVSSCDASLVSVAGDDDDTDAARAPGAGELCNGVDDDGDGRVDEGWTCTVCEDVPGGFDWVVPDDVPTIQDAIDAAATGERICVREGLYNEAIDFSGKDVLVYGEAGPSGTVVDATGWDAPVVTFDSGEGSGAELVGFTLTGGAGKERFDMSVTVDYCSSVGGPLYKQVRCGGGVYVDGADPILSDLVIEAVALAPRSEVSFYDGVGWAYVERLSVGAGICALNTRLTLERVDVRGVEAYHGGAAYFGSGAWAEWSESSFVDTEARSGGAVYLEGGQLSLTNVTSSQSSARQGAFAYVYMGSLEMVNVTAHEGEAESSVVSAYYSDITLRNVVIDYEYAGTGVGVYNYGELLDVSYSLVWSLTANLFDLRNSGAEVSGDSLVGMVSEGPTYRDLGASDQGGDDDLRLDSASAGVDVGSPSAAYLDPDGTRNDMGAFGGPGSDWW